MRSGFVTIHGIDGTGKSTAVLQAVSELRARQVDAVDFAELVIPDSAHTPHVNSNPQAKLARSLGTKHTQGAYVADAILDDKLVIKDRWVIDVFAANTFHGAQLPDSLPTILQPNLSVILICDEEERQKRVRQRPHPTPEDLTPKTFGTRANYFENFLLHHISDFAGRTTIVDAGRLSIQAVGTTIAEEILQS